METLFIDRKNCILRCNQQRLYITKSNDENKPISIPLNQMSSVVISSDCQLSSGMLRQLAKHHVSLICLNNRDPEASFISINDNKTNIMRRINQYHLLDNAIFRWRIATIIIKRKISRQRALLKRLQILRPEFDSTLRLCSASLLQSQKSLNQFPINGNEIMGIEGAASRTFFEAYRKVFNSNLQFEKRTRRPPKDPINAVLSLSYTLLYYEAQRACAGQSLDAYIPILHQPHYSRASLACDLQEALRADIEFWVWKLFKDRILRNTDFSIVEGACLMSKTGRRKFYLELPEALKKWRLSLRSHSRYLAKLFDSYQPARCIRGCDE